MEESFWYLLSIIALVFSAFFSGMEIAFITSNKLRIELDSKQGYFPAKILAMFNQKPSRFIGVMLLGNNTALVVFGIAMANILEPPIREHITANAGLVLLFQTVISTLIVLAFAEFLPKTIFRINPNRTLNIFALPIAFIYYLLWLPMIITIGISELVIKMLFKGDKPDDDNTFGRIDLDHYVKDSTERAKNQENLDHEIHIFKNALGFKDVKARDCMIPRTEIIALNVNDSVDKLRKKFIETGLSKILIFRDTVDNIIGYVHSLELFKQPENIKSILLPISIMPESKPAKEILEDLTLQKRSIAIVVDEFGGTSGIVTIEDVMEEIFGEIEDEHDSEELTEEKTEDNAYIFSARLEIDYLNEKYHLQLEENDEYETLAGYIIHETQTIPDVGEVLTIDIYRIEILKASSTKIETVKLSPKEEI